MGWYVSRAQVQPYLINLRLRLGHDKTLLTEWPRRLNDVNKDPTCRIFGFNCEKENPWDHGWTLPACADSVKEHNLICLPNKIRLNLINTFVMSRNKHISKKTPCFSRKRSKNEAKPNEFERRILKLSCYACSDNPKCWHELACLEMRVARMNFDYNLLRCMTETSFAALQ